PGGGPQGRRSARPGLRRRQAVIPAVRLSSLSLQVPAVSAIRHAGCTLFLHPEHRPIEFSRGGTVMAEAKDKVKNAIDNTADKAKEMTDKASDKAKSAARKAGEKVEEAGEKIKEKGS